MKIELSFNDGRLPLEIDRVIVFTFSEIDETATVTTVDDQESFLYENVDAAYILPHERYLYTDADKEPSTLIDPNAVNEIVDDLIKEINRTKNGD